MIVVTGGAGFIGSAIIWKLNKLGIKDILVVDHLYNSEKWLNLRELLFYDYIERDDFLNLIKNNLLSKSIECIVHMGACSSTTENNGSYLIKNNYEYTKLLAHYCINNNIRFIYASSAATYGNGENGFSDNEAELEKLRPLNMYGYSKHLFDLYAKSNNMLDKIVGLKFFNVFGPNEYHKGDMRSVIYKAYYQVKESGEINLFKSYNPDFTDGEQKRDFIYIKEAVNYVIFFIKNKNINGIFNIGSGNATSWNQLANAIFKALTLKPKINYIEMPENLKNKYQYYTKADMSKFNQIKLNTQITIPSYDVETAVLDYVCNYLEKNRKHLNINDN